MCNLGFHRVRNDDVKTTFFNTLARRSRRSSAPVGVELAGSQRLYRVAFGNLKSSQQQRSKLDTTLLTPIFLKSSTNSSR